MELIPVHNRDNPLSYYIPHYCVIQPNSKTTKLSVLFNASARISTGPKLHPDIQVVLLGPSFWKYLFMADMKQMYHQILVQPSDRDYLRILWRFLSSFPIDEYRLCTATYGTSATPSQALYTIITGQTYTRRLTLYQKEFRQQLRQWLTRKSNKCFY